MMTLEGASKTVQPVVVTSLPIARFGNPKGLRSSQFCYRPCPRLRRLVPTPRGALLERGGRAHGLEGLWCLRGEV